MILLKLLIESCVKKKCEKSVFEDLMTVDQDHLRGNTRRWMREGVKIIQRRGKGQDPLKVIVRVGLDHDQEIELLEGDRKAGHSVRGELNFILTV